MLCGVHILVWSLVISATSQQGQPRPGPGSGDGGIGDGGRRNGGSGDGGRGYGGSGDNGIGLGSPFLCSVTGNCSCQFDHFGDTIRCTSVGNNLDEIAKNLPNTTTHL